MPPLPADSIHARACKLKCEKILTRPLPHELVLVIIDSAQIIFRTQYINFHNDLPQKKKGATGFLR